MKCSCWIGRFGLVLSISLLILISKVSRARADDFPPRPLPADDQQTLDKYLGGGVVGDPVPAPALPHGFNDLISFGEQVSWRMRVIAGKHQGDVQSGSAVLLKRPGSTMSYRIDLGDGRNVLFGQVDSGGNVVCYSSQDNQEGVVSRFLPPQPIFLAGMAPGDGRFQTSDVEVADLSQPNVETHSGELNMVFTYLGAFRLHLPAGDIDAVLFKTHMSGKVGPASVDDTIYRFFAKDRGPVAIVETEDVSAFLVYNEKTRIGKVLVETITK
jgi:hypothetical protein